MKSDVGKSDLEKSRAVELLNAANGRIECLHQEVKMLVAALDQKELEINHLKQEAVIHKDEMNQVQSRLNQQMDVINRISNEKNESSALFLEQKDHLRSLQRLNSVHRSQIELLQKQLHPKDNELATMQEHMTHLHDANDSLVLQANLSDRMCRDIDKTAQEKDKQVKHLKSQSDRMFSVMVAIENEIAGLVKKSNYQEKSAVVAELVRIHKHLMQEQRSFNVDRDEVIVDQTAELIRQKQFFMKNTRSLNRRVESVNREKHQLIASLSNQNSILLSELNDLKKRYRELERKILCENKEQREKSSEESVHSSKAENRSSSSPCNLKSPHLVTERRHDLNQRLPGNVTLKKAAQSLHAGALHALQENKPAAELTFKIHDIDLPDVGAHSLSKANHLYSRDIHTVANSERSQYLRRPKSASASHVRNL